MRVEPTPLIYENEPSKIQLPNGADNTVIACFWNYMKKWKSIIPMVPPTHAQNFYLARYKRPEMAQWQRRHRWHMLSQCEH